MKNYYAIGVIIGGTNISIGLVNSNGEIQDQTKQDSRPRDGFLPGMDRIVQTIHELCRANNLHPKKISGIGVGCTGPVDPSTGIVVTDFTLPTWKGFSITKSLEEILQIPVILENNVDAAITGESFKYGDKYNRMVLLTLGTGVGGAAFISGQIYRGTQGEHPEIGHIPVRRGGPKCYCGFRGCLEMVASGPAIARAGKYIGLNSSPEVFLRARKGDKKAQKIINRAIYCLSIGIETLLHTFLPDAILLGGGVMENNYDLFEPSVLRVLNQAAMIPTNSVQVLRAQPGNTAGIIGAAILSLRKQNIL